MLPTLGISGVPHFTPKTVLPELSSAQLILWSGSSESDCLSFGIGGCLEGSVEGGRELRVLAVW